MSMNENGNGHDNNDSEKIVKFPTLAERDRIRKKQAKENEWRKSYKREQAEKRANNNNEPFFKFGNITPFTKYLVISFIAVQILTGFVLDDAQTLKTVYTFGFIPGAFTGTYDWHWTALLTPITYNFLHGGWVHLAFNAIMTVALGTFTEKLLGTRTSIKIFFLCGIAGALAYFIVNPYSITPVIGASGSISGFFAIILITLYEQNRFGALSAKFRGKGPWPIIIIWAAIMTLIGLIGGGIAWEAHLGGFLAGAALFQGLRYGKIRL
ncbi:MAG: rhomboid family intramembrane serine protease [Bdellovibrionales bacterium]